MNKETTSTVTELSIRIGDGGMRKIRGKSYGIILFEVGENIPAPPHPASRFPLPPLRMSPLATNVVEMMCELNYRDSVIKNLRRLRPVPKT
ncbi:hypothetical protein ES708_03962 [subsurface metagenome]